jgi:surfactin synthase thioesterase subunit
MTRASAVPLARWFAAPPRPRTLAMLFCLPYAGAGTSAFQGWAAALGPDVDVQPVVLPGRQARIAEPPGIDVAALASALAARADRPYAIYGHSLGARLGFEAVRELRRRGGPLPLRLYVGGCRPPEMAGPPDPYAGLSRLGEEELVARLAGLGGMPEALLAEPELLDLVLPAVRADFAWLDGYRYRPEPPLPVPIVAFAGDADPVATPLDMRGWARHTSAGFSLRTEPGDHFFLHPRREPLAAAVRADLLAAVARARAGGDGRWGDAPDPREVARP